MSKVRDILLKLIAVMGICFFTAVTIGAMGSGRKLAPFAETVSTVSDNWIIGMIANIVAKKMMNAAILCLMIGMTDFDC